MTARMGIRYVDQAGMLTVEGAVLFSGIAVQLAEAEAKLAAIAAVVAPVGGATVDAESRAAVAAIIAGAV